MSRSEMIVAVLVGGAVAIVWILAKARAAKRRDRQRYKDYWDH